MEAVIAIPITFALVVGAFAFLLLPHKPWLATMTAGLFMMLSLAVDVAVIEFYGKAKPIYLEWPWRLEGKAEVLGVVPIEGKAIFVWLALPGLDAPIAYELPWDTETAQQAQDAMQKAGEQGTGVEMRMEGDQGLDDREPMFWPRPVQPTAPKQYQESTPFQYNQGPSG